MRRSPYRRTSLERLSSPEKLDQLIHVTSPRGWIGLVSALSLLLAFVAWAFLGTVRTRVEGHGMLMAGAIYEVAPPEAGRVARLHVAVGDTVAAGQTVAELASSAPAPAPAAAPPSTPVSSPVAGRVVEILAGAGDAVGPGVPLLKLETPGAGAAAGDRSLRALVYVSTEDGKKVREGMEIWIAPATVEPAQYGYVVARVTQVSPFPVTAASMMRQLRNEQLVQELAAGGAPFEVTAALEPDPATPSGYRWTSRSGPPAALQAGTPARARITVRTQRPVQLAIPGVESPPARD